MRDNQGIRAYSTLLLDKILLITSFSLLNYSIVAVIVLLFPLNGQLVKVTVQSLSPFP